MCTGMHKPKGDEGRQLACIIQCPPSSQSPQTQPSSDTLGLARLSQPLICWQQHAGKGCYQSLLSKRSCQMISSTTC